VYTSGYLGNNYFRAIKPLNYWFGMKVGDWTIMSTVFPALWETRHPFEFASSQGHLPNDNSKKIKHFQCLAFLGRSIPLYSFPEVVQPFGLSMMSMEAVGVEDLALTY
jgi:hypothetical protein